MISVAGHGRASAPPDVVRIRLGVTVLRPNAAAAVADADAGVRRVRTVLAALRVPPQDASTEALSVQAEQVWTEQQGPRITGFRADHQLLVTLHDLAAVGQVLGEVLAAGADDVRLNGVEFAVDDETPLRARAREAAWQDALARATQLAALAGRPLGAVREIAEEGQQFRPARRRAMADGPLNFSSPPMDVQPGSATVEVTLAVEWALD